jgi:hypothetical protein
LQTTDKIDKVIFVCFDDESFELINRELNN